jgi:hypothetical protein
VYQLPDHEEVIGLSVRCGPATHLLQKVDHNRLLELYADQPTEFAGRPVFFSLWEKTFYLFPPPKDDWDLVLRYVPAIQEA